MRETDAICWLAQGLYMPEVLTNLLDDQVEFSIVKGGIAARQTDDGIVVEHDDEAVAAPVTGGIARFDSFAPDLNDARTGSRLRLAAAARRGSRP